jgi:hypothetical protein
MGESLATLPSVAFQPGALQPEPRPSGEIDYRLARRRLLAAFRAGRVARHEVCDAHPELRRAGAQVGTPTRQRCPVCDDALLSHVTYVFGPRLPAFGRCITSTHELQRLAQRKGEHTAYVVEVCPHCAWNHLVRAWVLSPGSTR